MSEPQNETPNEGGSETLIAGEFDDHGTFYASVRYAVNYLENSALEGYWITGADPQKKDEILACLNAAGVCLDGIVNEIKNVGGDDCPWSLCGNGSCRPVCME